MILRYYGHSLFTLALESGLTVATDPYGDFYGYPRRRLKADLATVSHHHHDHDALEMLQGVRQVIDAPGAYYPARDLTVTGIATWHDEQRGAQRGENTVFILQAEGLRLVHLGDLGHVLTDRQCAAIGMPDVLLTPVGGRYTTDAPAALENVRRLRPRITIPMHYRTPYDPEMPIETERPFLALMGAEPAPLPLCRLSAGDIGERPSVLLLGVTPPGAA